MFNPKKALGALLSLQAAMACNTKEVEPDDVVEIVEPLGQMDLTKDLRSIDYAVTIHGDIGTCVRSPKGQLYCDLGDCTGLSGRVPSLDGMEPGEAMRWPSTYDPDNDCFTLDTSNILCGGMTEFCQANECSECMPMAPYMTACTMQFDSLVQGDLNECAGEPGCLYSRHLAPGGESRFLRRPGEEHKPSSKIWTPDGECVTHVHNRPHNTSEGYLLRSTDNCLSHELIPGSPWKGSSPCKVMMFAGSTQSEDSQFGYALCVEQEFNCSASQDAMSMMSMTACDAGGPPVCAEQGVVAVRFPKSAATDYSVYRYWNGKAWSENQFEAVALPGLSTFVLGSVIKHGELFFFLSGFNSLDETGFPHAAVFVSSDINQGWRKAGTIEAAYIASWIPEFVDENTLCYAYSGGTTQYKLQTACLDLTRIRQAMGITGVSQ